MALFAIGGSILFLAFFGRVSRPLRSAAFSFIGALALSLFFTLEFNFRSDASVVGGPVLQVDYLLGTLLGGITGFVVTLPLLFVVVKFGRHRGGSFQ